MHSNLLVSCLVDTHLSGARDSGLGGAAATGGSSSVQTFAPSSDSIQSRTKGDCVVLSPWVWSTLEFLGLCMAYVHIPKDKLDSMTRKCTLLRYGSVQKGYTVFDHLTQKVLERQIW